MRAITYTEIEEHHHGDDVQVQLSKKFLFRLAVNDGALDLINASKVSFMLRSLLKHLLVVELYGHSGRESSTLFEG